MLSPLLVTGAPDTSLHAVRQLLTRIGLANPVVVSATAGEAKEYLRGCATSRLPVAILTCVPTGSAEGLSLIEWMREQPDAIASIDAIVLLEPDDEDMRAQADRLMLRTVPLPVEMRPLIAALKALELPEKARIDAATLTVHVELWPRAGGVSRQ
jgi:CheY-like chemotaxis protein